MARVLYLAPVSMLRDSTRKTLESKYLDLFCENSDVRSLLDVNAYQVTQKGI